MWIKVDLSTEAKKNPRPDMPGMYAIYTKKHWWNKWTEKAIYADLHWCIRDAKRLKTLPKKFVQNFNFARYANKDKKDKL